MSEKTITVAETDSHARIWHVLERADGSISVYYTLSGNSAHFVVWDSLDNAAAELTDLRAENARLREHVERLADFCENWLLAGHAMTGSNDKHILRQDIDKARAALGE